MGKACYCLIIKIDERKVTTKKILHSLDSVPLYFALTFSAFPRSAIRPSRLSIILSSIFVFGTKVYVRKAKESLSEWNLYIIDFSRLIGTNVVVVLCVCECVSAQNNITSKEYQRKQSNLLVVLPCVMMMMIIEQKLYSMKLKSQSRAMDGIKIQIYN